MHKGWYKTLEEDDDNGFAQFGGYMEAKKAKLIKQVREQAGTEQQSDIFKGVSIYVNGFTKPTAEELKTMMALHGGMYHIYQMPSTTHIIASNLPNVKINKLGPLPIVKPSWIEDSITLGRLLDYTTYLLYTNQNRMQPQINFEKAISEESLSTTKTASDPAFLSEFYGNSRLHLIATLGAECKQYINDCRARMGKSHQFPGVQFLQASSSAEQEQDEVGADIIMHIDMDCFFVSVGIRNRPELRGKPVAVTHSRTGQGRPGVDRSVEIAMHKERLPAGAAFRLEDIDDSSSLAEIASCSYEARRVGVRNGMFMGQALKLCPALVAIPYDFDDYKKVSRTLYATIAEYTLDVEAVSCDEMYVNVGCILASCGCSVEEFATHVRTIIQQRTGCPCSAGFGANRLQARMATKRAKPDGHFHLLPDAVTTYFDAVPLGDLPGVGRSLAAKLRHLGLETCGEARAHGLRALQAAVGRKLGETLFSQAAGIDNRPLQYEHARKSVSAEVNYGIRFRTSAESVAFLTRLADEVTVRLVDTGMRTKCVTLKLMARSKDAPAETAKYLGHGVCDSISKSTSLQLATDDRTIINKECQSLLEKLAIPFQELRGVGIQLSKLETPTTTNALLKKFLNSATSAKEAKAKQAVPMRGRQGRGRPSKQARGCKTLTTFFKTARTDRNNSSCNNVKSAIERCDIDLTVLQELPEDIRLEVMQQYKLEQPPAAVVSAHHQPVVTTTGFEALSHDGFMDMLANWLQSHAKPLPIDIAMLGDHFQRMATQRQIERLHIYMRYLHRRIDKMADAEWRTAYETLSARLQEGMLATYSSRLRIAGFDGDAAAGDC